MSYAGAFGLLEPLIENSSNAWGTGDAAREKMRKDQRYDTLELERQGIQAKVDGARAAGIHPLAVLGNVGGYSPSIPVGASSYSGMTAGLQNDLRSAETAKNSSEDKMLRTTQQRLLNAQVRSAEARASMDETDAAVHRSQSSLATQPGQAPPLRSLTDRDNIIEGQGTSPMGGSVNGRLKPGIKVIPNEVPAGKGGLTAGTHQGMTEVKVPVGSSGRTVKLTVPAGVFNNALDDMELFKYGAIALANAHKAPRAMWDFATEDVPWALRGYYGDFRSWANKLPGRHRADIDRWKKGGHR